MEGTIGEIRLFAGNFAPKDWALCSGQILAIAQNTALFSILGTTYGGNGTTNFQLPNFNASVVMGAGQGPGLTNRIIGETGGAVLNTLSMNEMPPHTHTAQGTVNPAASSAGGQTSPANNFPATAPSGSNIYGNPATANVLMGQNQVSVTLSPSGNGQAFGNRQPYLGLNYIICLRGIFPSRG
jgi:microcystin-dependent protein